MRPHPIISVTLWSVPTRQPENHRTRRLACPATVPLRGSGRAISGDLLPGQLLHYAGSERIGKSGVDRKHAQQFRLPHRHPGLYPDSEPDLLSEPLTTTASSP